MRTVKLWIVFSILTVLVLFQNCSVVGTPQDDIAGLSSKSYSEQDLLESKAFRVINNRCASCHSAEMPSGGIDYITNLDSLLYYRMVIPGEPQLSVLYNVIQSGEMPPGKPLSISEAKDIHDWILDGFKESTPTVTPPPPNAPLAPTFASITARIIQPRCLGCHNNNRQDGGVNLATYQGVRNTVQPGNLNASTFYTEVNAGTMPRNGNRLTNTEISTIGQWIMNGALNN